jgi:hypothetical protein
MSWRPLILLFGLAACGGAPIPSEDLLLRIDVETREVELGQAFPLSVTRVWDKRLTPASWHDEVLTPVRLRLLETTRRENNSHVRETRTYAAYVFEPGDVVVPGPAFLAIEKRGGNQRRVDGNELRLRVRSALDPDRPGPVELPDRLPARRSWLPWALGGAALLLIVLLLAKRRPDQPAAAEPPPSPEAGPASHVRALERIEGLRQQHPQSHAGWLTLCVELSALLRDYLDERFALPAWTMTSEELLAAHPTTSLRRALHACDLVKFARHAPRPGQRDQLLDAAEAFVRETA